MKEKYYLNGGALPTIPAPHDCVINKAEFDGDCLTFCFNDISKYDSIKFIRPKAKSLKIRFHTVLDDGFSADVYRADPAESGDGNFDFKHISADEFAALSGKQLEYLYHYVGYSQIMIKLFYETFYLLDVQSVDYIEFDWEE